LFSSHVAGPECHPEGGARILYALHRRYRTGDYKTWKYIAPVQDEEMHAALDVNLPSYASAIVSTKEIVASVSAL